MSEEEAILRRLRSASLPCVAPHSYLAFLSELLPHAKGD